MSALISIIIPVYNHAELLSRVFDSIEKQTYKKVEVIVVDDGSDVELATQEPIVSRRLKIQLLRQEHRGAPAARNAGFRASIGDYVIFWDADVIGEPHMLQSMFEALQTNLQASYAYSSFRMGKKRMPCSVFDGEKLKKINYVMTTSLIRRADFPGFDESLKKFQDWDLWLTMLEQSHGGVWIPEYLFSVVPHIGGISSWLPSCAYRAPFSWMPGIRERVKVYEQAREIILRKHDL